MINLMTINHKLAQNSQVFIELTTTILSNYLADMGLKLLILDNYISISPIQQLVIQ